MGESRDYQQHARERSLFGGEERAGILAQAASVAQQWRVDELLRRESEVRARVIDDEMWAEIVREVSAWVEEKRQMEAARHPMEFLLTIYGQERQPILASLDDEQQHRLVDELIGLCRHIGVSQLQIECMRLAAFGAHNKEIAKIHHRAPITISQYRRWLTSRLRALSEDLERILEAVCYDDEVGPLSTIESAGPSAALEREMVRGARQLTAVESELNQKISDLQATGQYEHIIAEFLYLIPANIRYTKVPRCFYDEAYSIARVALWKAAVEFDASRNYSFVHYVAVNIRSDVIDEFRRFYKMNRSTGEIREPTLLPKNMSLDDQTDDGRALYEIIPNPEFASSVHTELGDIAQATLRHLNPRHCKIMLAHMQGMKASEIARKLDVTDERVYQLLRLASAASRKILRYLMKQKEMDLSD